MTPSQPDYLKHPEYFSYGSGVMKYNNPSISPRPESSVAEVHRLRNRVKALSGKDALDTGAPVPHNRPEDLKKGGGCPVTVHILKARRDLAQ